MYKAVIIALCTLVFMGCDEKIADCESKICTEQFVSVTIKFTEADGKAVAVKDFSVVNQRTGDTLKSPSAAYSSMVKGSYIVADDHLLSKLSEQGDDLKVSGTHEDTNATKSAILKVSGGICACHIHKISGPDTILF